MSSPYPGIGAAGICQKVVVVIFPRHQVSGQSRRSEPFDPAGPLAEVIPDIDGDLPHIAGSIHALQFRIIRYSDTFGAEVLAIRIIALPVDIDTRFDRPSVIERITQQ